MKNLLQNQEIPHSASLHSECYCFFEVWSQRWWFAAANSLL